MSDFSLASTILSRRFRIVFASISFLALGLLAIPKQTFSPESQFTHFNTWSLWRSKPSERNIEVALVVASQTRDNTSWLHDAFLEWQKNIYVTDDENADMTVPANKGREGMVYLTYIIDQYEHLPQLLIFHHANRYQRHNDDPLYDGQRILSRLKLDYVLEVGFANLRCVWTLGCPIEIRPLVESAFAITIDSDEGLTAHAGWYYQNAWEELFPDTPVPEEVGTACCGQFAVTAETIRKRPKQDYERYRTWLLNTDLRDDLSGRILEYAWHVIFGQDAVFCPDARDCYCKLYGLCDLKCESKGVCAAQYKLPHISNMPKGWPDYDRKGNWQNASVM